MNVAIIPARGGSTRIPGKNIKPFHGLPIIAYSIATAKASKLFDRIIVSTDDKTIKHVARHLGAEVDDRPWLDSQNHVGTQEVMAGVLGRFVEKCGMYEMACCIYATAPLLLPDDLYNAKQVMDSDGPQKTAYVMAVNQDPLFDAGAFYMGIPEAFMSGTPLIGPRTRMYPLPKERVCDINTLEDWARAQQLWKEKHK